MIITRRIRRRHLVLLSILAVFTGLILVKVYLTRNTQQPPPAVAWIVRLQPDAPQDFHNTSAAIGSDGFLYVTEFNSRWLWKLDQSGKVVWDKQLLSPYSEDTACTIMQGRNKCLYVHVVHYSGHHSIAVLQPDGTLLTQRRLTKYDSKRPVNEIAIDNCGWIHMVGYDYDSSSKLYIDRYNDQGELMLSRTSSITKQTWAGKPSCTAVDTDTDCNTYIAGSAEDPFDGVSSNAFVARFSHSGSLKWLVPIDLGRKISSGAICTARYDRVYVAGSIETPSPNKTKSGSLSDRLQRRIRNWQARRSRRVSGDGDYFVARYDSSGKQVWLRQARVNTDDYALAVAVDDNGSPYITGSVWIERYEAYRPFAAKYNAKGNLIWRKEFLLDEEAHATGICIDKKGDVYVYGDLEESEECFVAKLVDK